MTLCGRDRPICFPPDPGVCRPGFVRPLAGSPEGRGEVAGPQLPEGARRSLGSRRDLHIPPARRPVAWCRSQLGPGGSSGARSAGSGRARARGMGRGRRRRPAAPAPGGGCAGRAEPAAGRAARAGAAPHRPGRRRGRAGRSRLARGFRPILRVRASGSRGAGARPETSRSP
jgi:hypothetical protein